jgi:hypothetical protein
MFPQTRFQLVKFAAIILCGAIYITGNPSSAEELIQNLGPVRASEGLLAAAGTMRVIAFFEPGDGRCAVNAVVWDTLGADPGESAKRVRVNIEPNQIIYLDSARQESLQIQCGSNAETLKIIDIQSLSATGITPQPPTQAVKP